jgi:hypothetical protein
VTGTQGDMGRQRGARASCRALKAWIDRPVHQLTLGALAAGLKAAAGRAMAQV